MKYAAYNIFFIVAITLTGVACTTTETRTYNDDFKELNTVNSGDGINKEEAYVIAKAFFWSNISGCGFPEIPVKEGNNWVSQTRIGYAGVSGEPIYIDVTNGIITWGDKHSVVSLEELKSKSNTSLQATPKSVAPER